MDAIMEFLSTAGTILTVLSLGFTVFMTWVGWTGSKYSEYAVPAHWIIIAIFWFYLGLPIGLSAFIVTIPFIFIYSLLPEKGWAKEMTIADMKELSKRKPDLYNTMDIYFSRHS